MVTRFGWFLGVFSLACTDGEPNEAKLDSARLLLGVADGVDSWFSIAELEDSRFHISDCTGIETVLETPSTVDLLGSELEIPGGEWCGIRMEFRGPLSLQGETSTASVFELVLELDELEMWVEEGVRLDGTELLFELGVPGWVRPENLGIEPSATFQLTDSHPQHPFLVRQLTASSAVYVDTNGDREIGESERADGPVMEGVGEFPAPIFFAMGDAGRSLVSPDGEDWWFDQVHSEVLRGAARSHGMILAVGGDEIGHLQFSLEGEFWMDSTLDSGAPLLDVASDGWTAVTVGMDGRIGSSVDLVDWTEQVDEDGISLYEDHFHAVAYGGEGFVVVGEDGVKMWSPDGLTWEREPGTISLYDVAWGETFFIAVGQGGARKQADEQGHWSTPVFGGEDLTGIAYGEERWVAVGPGRCLISDDGWDWEAFPQEVDLERVAFGDGLFVATSADGLYTSPDGIRWTELDAGDEEFLPFIDFLP